MLLHIGAFSSGGGQRSLDSLAAPNASDAGAVRSAASVCHGPYPDRPLVAWGIYGAGLGLLLGLAA
jgi:hypothetical protein